MEVRSREFKDSGKNGGQAQPGGNWAWRWYMCSGEDAQRSPGKPMLTDNGWEAKEVLQEPDGLPMCTSFPISPIAS